MAFSRLVESFQTNEVSHIFHFSVSFFFLFFFPRKIQKARAMDLFTNAAAILNKLDLRSVMGCPGGNEHILFSIYERLAGHFVLKFKTIRFLWEKRSLCRVKM